MIVTIHQPEFFPWLGFFHKMNLADVMVLLDATQFKKNNWQNRNKININGQAAWISMPIAKHSLSTDIKDVKINWDAFDIEKKHLSTIQQQYSKCEYFEDLFKYLKSLYFKKHEYLADFNFDLITQIARNLGIDTKIIKSSDLSLSGNAQDGTELTLEICQMLNADTYIAGGGAHDYFDQTKYDQVGVKVYYQDYIHPVYEQKGNKEFVSHLSIIDLIFNHGPKSLDILMKENVLKPE